MPIYEYRCDACGAKKEAIQKVSAAPLLDCEACGEPKLRKLMSAAGFRLKGKGWYETDFKNSDRKKNLAGDQEKGGSRADNGAPADAGSKGGAGKDDGATGGSGKSQGEAKAAARPASKDKAASGSSKGGGTGAS